MLGFIVFGLIVGGLARLFKPGKQNLSLGMTLLVGLAGSIVGGTLANLIGSGRILELNFLGTVFAVIASVLFLGIAEGMAGKRR